MAAELAQGNGETSSGVLVARYFLANHLTRNQAPDRALSALAPALHGAPDYWFICLAHAEALFALGQTAESRAAAERAIANAPTAERSAEPTKHLSEILGASSGAAS